MSHSSNHFAIVMVVLAGIMWAGSGIGAQSRISSRNAL